MATEWVLDEVLKPVAIRIDNVDVKTLPFPEMLPALDNGAIHCGIVTEPFATQAEEKNIGVRPLKAKPGAKPVPITVAFWNSDWAKKNDSAARAFMSGYLRAVRDLSEPNAWKAPVHTEIISKHTGVGAAVLLKTRAPVFSSNLELDDKEMMSQQEFNLRLGYLKYKEMKPIKELIDLSYAEGRSNKREGNSGPVQDVPVVQAPSFILPRVAGEDQKWGIERSAAVERLERFELHEGIYARLRSNR